jgi:hypothetical protein
MNRLDLSHRWLRVSSWLLPDAQVAVETRPLAFDAATKPCGPGRRTAYSFVLTSRLDQTAGADRTAAIRHRLAMEQVLLFQLGCAARPLRRLVQGSWCTPRDVTNSGRWKDCQRSAFSADVRGSDRKSRGNRSAADNNQTAGPATWLPVNPATMPRRHLRLKARVFIPDSLRRELSTTLWLGSVLTAD